MQGNFTKRRRQKGASKPKPCTALLNRTLSTNILKKAKLLYQLNQQLKRKLPKPINQHCWLMDWTLEEMTFGVDAAEWLIHIREYEREVKAYIAPHIKVSPTIKVKYLVRPQMYKALINKSIPPRGASRISSQNRDLLQTIASTIKDEKLKTIMLKLASD